MSKRGFFMEKAELITELYNLRSALFLLDLVYRPISNKEAFESLWYNKNNWNTWDSQDKDITILRLSSAPLVTTFDPASNEEWDFWGNVYKIYYLNSSHPYFKAIEHKIKAYNLLYDWIFNDRVFKRKIGGVYRSVGLKLGEDTDKMSDFIAIINTFRFSNINVLYNSLWMCEDALTNKNSKVLKYYNRWQIKAKIIPALKGRIKKRLEEVENGQAYNRVKGRYGTACPRSEEEVDSDNRKLKEIQEAMESLKQQYKLIDSRDWDNIDSVIYLLETGRADTIKEALNLADTKKYREDIISAVNTLNRTMARGFQTLLTNLDNYFGQMFEKLDLIKEAIYSVSDAIVGAAAEMQATSESIASSLRTIETRVIR